MLAPPVLAPLDLAPPKDMVRVPGGSFRMGSPDGPPDERPVRNVTLSPFLMDRHEVTNAQFAAFVRATGYRTDAERPPDPRAFPDVPKRLLRAGAGVFATGKGWAYVPGANWRHPGGPRTTIAGRGRHPVVQVSWTDAASYAKWAGRSLPTEAQWEYAARGGVGGKPYIWGAAPFSPERPQANIWQGDFPVRNLVQDGYAATAPVMSFPPNPFGLYDMAGNVWEWCADRYRPDAYRTSSARNPKGPRTSLDPSDPGSPVRVLRGGSFLCADCYCKGYRPSARMRSSPDTGLFHAGFRCVADLWLVLRRPRRQPPSIALTEKTMILPLLSSPLLSSPLLSSALLARAGLPAVPPSAQTALSRTQGRTADTKPERTVFQTHRPYSDRINLRGDVAIVYGFEADMPDRVRSWREKGYKVHLMTGVAWGEYQDYYFGRWDGKDHTDEAQTRSNGEKIGHGGDVYYMSPGKEYGKYLAEGVRRALDVGVEAVHLEEPEFWSWGGYGEGFKREWQEFYNEPWQDPVSSADARWRASKLMYYLYRRALTQVFASIQDYNREKGTNVRCYVPTHSLLNYADWGIVSPQQSLALIPGCDGYIAQVWTGTAREKNVYRGVKRERTFETAFLEYGSMQNLVRSTGRSVWYLADPIEDNASHDWGDYRRNYEATLIASLLQPDVASYEIAPWPERILNDKYPSEADPKKRVLIPGAYATQLGVVFNALKDMKQRDTEWMGGSKGIGLVVSDSLMFQRGGGDPNASDDDFGHVYGLALPFVKRGMPVAPIQLENVGLKGYLDGTKTLLMSYEGQKPLAPEVHDSLAKWTKSGGTLVVVDDGKDPFNRVREWWNSNGMTYASPREHLFARLGAPLNPAPGLYRVGNGRLLYMKESPSKISREKDGAERLVAAVRRANPRFDWRETSSLALRRGPYIAASGMDETDSPVTTLKGSFVDLFDPELKVLTQAVLGPDSRHFLVDLKRFKGNVVAVSGECKPMRSARGTWRGTVEGIADTPGILLLRAPNRPKSVTLDGAPLTDTTYDPGAKLLWLRFPNGARPRMIEVSY